MSKSIIDIKLASGWDHSASPIEVIRRIAGSWLEAVIGKPLDEIVRSVFTDESLRQIDELKVIAKRLSPGYAPSDFRAFLCIHLDSGAEEVVAHLRELREIEIVSIDPVIEMESKDFQAPACNSSSQRHLEDAPIGVGAIYAWGKGSSGAGIKVADVEEGWVLGIQDFNGVNIVELGGGINQKKGHGTKVLSIVAANNNGVGATGIAHGLREFDLAPTFRIAGNMHNVPAAMVSACSGLNQGDVLLLEVARAYNGQVPIETRPPVLHVIGLAVASQICVIEPAGNGGQDISSAVVANSGAILVGAVDSISKVTDPYTVAAQSNYGKRVDVYAWGDHICTSGMAGMSYFDGTSGASAIVAGVVAVIQGVALSKGKAVSPGAMQNLLRTYGSDVLQGSGKKEGKVPDLRLLLANI